MTPLPDDTPALRPLNPDAAPLRPIVFSGHPAAMFLDGFVLLMISLGGGMMVGLALEAFPSLRTARTDGFEVAAFFLLLLCTAGDIAFAASPGKWMLGVVVRAANGAPAPRWRLALRWAIKYSPALLLLAKACVMYLARPMSIGGGFLRETERWIEALATVCFWCLVAGAFLALLPSRRTLHDFLAGTAVFDAARIARDAGPPQRGFDVAPVPVAALPADPDETAASTPSAATSDPLS